MLVGTSTVNSLYLGTCVADDTILLNLEKLRVLRRKRIWIYSCAAESPETL